MLGLSIILWAVVGGLYTAYSAASVDYHGWKRAQWWTIPGAIIGWVILISVILGGVLILEYGLLYLVLHFFFQK